MNFWDLVWLGWMVFLVLMDVIASFHPGQTFSEHCRQWFKSPLGAVTLGVFFLVLYLHFVIDWPVYPVIVVGIGIAHFVRKGYIMFRLDKWVEGALVSGILALSTAVAPLVEDGKVTGTEWVMMLGFFLSGIGLYIKTHPPTLEDAEKKIEQEEAEGFPSLAEKK